ncbi:hypothetical protein [Streptomyces nogalater]|uniref:Uncharacterized protein n=1 Tax=Streptomyces nogalater TaxID=38314 RepID=A0ABW0WDH8_STRNO
MASLLGTHVPIDCPICPDHVAVPVKEAAGAGPGDLVVEIDLTAWREHVATVHTAARRAAV